MKKKIKNKVVKEEYGFISHLNNENKIVSAHVWNLKKDNIHLR